MNKLINISFLLSIFFVLTSCEKDIDVDFGSFKSQLVVNSIFSTNETWNVDITNSRNILDTESSIDDVKDAVVTITDRTTLEETILFYSDELELYTSAEKPDPYGSYRIDVEHENYQSAHAVNKVPSKIEVGRIDTSTVIFEGEESLLVNFNIIDNKEEDNFYVWDLVEANSENISDILPSQNAELYSNDVNSEVIADESVYGQSKIFIQDNNFNGTQYETSFLSVKGRNTSLGDTSQETGGQVNVKLQLRILTVSEDLFEYLKSVEKFYRSNSANTSAVNPIEIQSNVKNGLGIFGAYEVTLIDIN